MQGAAKWEAEQPGNHLRELQAVLLTNVVTDAYGIEFVQRNEHV